MSTTASTAPGGDLKAIEAALERARQVSENRDVRYELVVLGDIEVHPGYQRDPEDPQFKARRKDIVENFNAALFKPLDVAEHNGHKYVWDGQCRKSGAEERVARGKPKPGDKVMCAIIDATPEEQADLFILQEHRRNVVWADKHRALLFRGDERANVIQEVFDELGFTLGKHGDVRAVQACYSTVEIDRSPANPRAALRGDLLKTILEIAQAVWYDASDPNKSGVRTQYATSDRMIDALALVLNEFTAEELDRAELVKALHTQLPSWLVQRSAKASSQLGSNNKGALAAEIINLYNRVTGQKLRKTRVLTRRQARKATRTRRPRATKPTA